jgi:hypothetical protein
LEDVKVFLLHETILPNTNYLKIGLIFQAVSFFYLIVTLSLMEDDEAVLARLNNVNGEIVQKVVNAQ